MKNWKTTLAALLINLAYACIAAYSAGGVSMKDVLAMIGLQAVGTLAKDFNVTGSQQEEKRKVKHAKEKS